MARRGTRSPSPAGSSYAPRRGGARRDDDRYARDRRDDGRANTRRRSRSRSPDRYRERDRDRRRRERSTDRRREDDVYRPTARRDRSRDRRRSRDRSPVRDRRRDRDRDRDRDHRDSRRDDSRDRHWRRGDDSADSRRKGRGDDGKDRPNGKSAGADPAQGKQTDEEKVKAERLAKAEAWKAKQKAKRENELQSAGSTRTILEEMDKKAAGIPITPAEPTPTEAPTEDAQPSTSYAGKFDPKAIAKRAHATANTSNTLGDDIAIPQHKIPQAAAAAPSVGVLRAGVTGFGLGSKRATEADKVASKKALDFAEEESSRKKLEKLPTLPADDGAAPDDAQANEADGEVEDEDVDMADVNTEEEAAAAARAAAEKREQRLQEESRAAETNGDVAMADAAVVAKNETVQAEQMQPEDDADPLDAFMSGLGDPDKDLKIKAARQKGKGKVQEPEAMFSDDEGDLAGGGRNMEDMLATTHKKKKKDIPTVDHSKMDYQPFRKAFYAEPVELADMTEEELAELRRDLDGIKVRGVNVPKPVTKWAQCGLGVQTLDVIRKLNYETPTSIQTQAIPAIMSGRDVIGVAKTGSGKTIAFLLPMFRHIKDQRPLEGLDGPIGLIMTPTRELATQIHRECKPFLKALNLRAVCAYGGAPIKDQIADLKRGAEIIVCTPGRMIDLLAANSGRVTNLRRVTYTVLDEADRMFDMGFEPQVMKILANIRPQRQIVLFSATFPRNMEALARKVLAKPVEIIVGGRSVVAPEITQVVEVREENTKFVRLLELLGDLYYDDWEPRTLIFVDRQESADWLLKELYRKNYHCMSTHGGKDQSDRDSAIEDFKSGDSPILIATSVAARGLDVKQLMLVVNYDAPNHLEDYVHRAGRTGRAGNKGTAVTFITPEQDRYCVDITKALKQSGQEVPEAVQAMTTAFLEKVKAGREKASGSGFGGKGLERLDQDREAARNRERKSHKTGDEPDEEEKDEGKKESGIVVKSRDAAPTADVATPSAPSQAAPAADALDPASASGMQKSISEISGRIVVHKTEPAAGAAGGKAGPHNPLDRVKAAVANIDSRLTQRGQLRPGQPIDNKGPDAGAFHATLEINDEPQKARWAVTNRTNVAKILEATGTSITTKGNYYAAGKVPGPGEQPKLYILVEGDTELVVTQAMEELARLMVEGRLAAENTAARAPTRGRYDVV